MRSSQVEGDALLAQIRAGSAPAVVDVRSGWEFRRGHVPGATHIPFWTMAGRISEVPAPRESAVVVYCGHGPRAYLAGAVLRLVGFRRVHYLRGHMRQWRRSHFPEQK
jgi:hydroxyacylglutathione hydrolase